MTVVVIKEIFSYFISVCMGHHSGIQPHWLWLPNSSEITLTLLLPGALTWCGEMLPAVMKPTAPINQSACLHLSVCVWMCWCVCAWSLPLCSPGSACEKETLNAPSSTFINYCTQEGFSCQDEQMVSEHITCTILYVCVCETGWGC